MMAEMISFPKLKTGAISQYPSTRETSFTTRVQRYLDLGEQRHRDYAGARRRWRIKLSLLTDTELAQLVNFFAAHKGRLTSFDFEDPWSGATISGCRFEQDSLPTFVNGEADSSTEFTVVGPVGL
jgi:uncharacterized protein (TIGR02217 family)